MYSNNILKNTKMKKQNQVFPGKYRKTTQFKLCLKSPFFDQKSITADILILCFHHMVYFPFGVWQQNNFFF